MNNNYSELYHHGIQGQKWGVRRFQNEDGTLTPEGQKRYGNAVEYTKSQYMRDKELYGVGGANRVNKKTLKGMQVSGARTKEADRVHIFSKTAKINGKINKIIGAIGGLVVGLKAAKVTPSTGDSLLDAGLATLMTSGGVLVGQFLGEIGGKSMVMVAGGYSPGKIRN